MLVGMEVGGLLRLYTREMVRVWGLVLDTFFGASGLGPRESCRVSGQDSEGEDSGFSEVRFEFSYCSVSNISRTIFSRVVCGKLVCQSLMGYGVGCCPT